MQSFTRLLPKLPITMLVLASWATEVRAGDAPTSFTLPNELRVRLVPLEGEKRVAVLLGVRAGFFDEPRGLEHVAHVAEHILVFGAAAGSEEEKAISRWYEGGQANAETLAGWMYFDLFVTPEELGRAL